MSISRNFSISLALELMLIPTAVPYESSCFHIVRLLSASQSHQSLPKIGENQSCLLILCVILSGDSTFMQGPAGSWGLLAMHG